MKMSTEMHLIPLSIIKDIRCAQCNKFVTCGPVTVVPNDNVLCGRCYRWAKQEFRNHAFETLAQIFWFPCSNWEKRCSRKLQWNQSLDHEDSCAYENCCSRFWSRGICCSSRRDIPIGDIRHTPVPPKFLDAIKCIQCHGYANCEPVFILPDGSNVCHRCNLANGPPPDGIRNLAYEQLSRILVFPCIFRNRGCPTRLKFGGDLWEHESKCPYNTSLRRQSQTNKKPSQKERGVITTHSGHYYGTLTPNSPLFAPPTPDKDYVVNKQIVKSLKKHQERRITKADQLQSQMSERYSEDGYNEDNSYNSRASTPSRYEDDVRQRMHGLQNQDRYSPENRDSGYLTASRPKFEDNYQNMMPKIHDSQLNRSSIPRYIPLPDYDRETPRSPDNILEGYFPEIYVTEPDPLAHNPSFRAINRSESVKSNQELIKELKVKLKSNNSIRNDIESPYVKCKNLEDVLVAHDKLSP